MARTPAQAKALEAKAVAAETKSDGMRMLLEAGYSVLETKDIMGAQYGFVYGVAKRAGLIEPTPRVPKAEKVAKAKPAAKAAPKTTAAKATTAKPKARVAPRTRTARAKAAAKA